MIKFVDPNETHPDFKGQECGFANFHGVNIVFRIYPENTMTTIFSVDPFRSRWYNTCIT